MELNFSYVFGAEKGESIIMTETIHVRRNVRFHMSLASVGKNF